MSSLKRTQAARIIEEHFRYLKRTKNVHDVLVSAREAGRRMVEIYRLLTGEMPQASGIEVEYIGDELPGVEFASPTERDPNDVYYVHPGQGGNPDILTKGDQNESETKDRKELQSGDHNCPRKLLGNGG